MRNTRENIHELYKRKSIERGRIESASNTIMIVFSQECNVIECDSYALFSPPLSLCRSSRCSLLSPRT